MTQPFKVLLITALLLIFQGQVLASVSSSCTMMQVDTNMMAGMDHSQHGMPVELDDEPMACCGDPACAMANCIAAPVLTSTVDMNLFADVPKDITVAKLFAYISPQYSSLYRPPITA